MSSSTSSSNKPWPLLSRAHHVPPTLLARADEVIE